MPALQRDKAQHCTQRGWTKHWRDHRGDTQKFSSNKETSRVRPKEQLTFPVWREKHFHAYCTQPAPIFNFFLWTKSQTQLHTQPPQGDSELLAKQPNGIFDNSHCSGCTWKRVLSSSALRAPHCKPQLPQQNQASTMCCSYPPDEHFMNWNSNEPNSGNNYFYKQEITIILKLQNQDYPQLIHILH